MSHDDEDRPTPPDGWRRLHWGDDQRVHIGAQSRRDRRAPALGVPVQGPAKERDTDPIDLLLVEELEPEDHARVERLRRDSRDPYIQLWNLAKATVRRTRSEERSSREMADAVSTAIAEQGKVLGALQTDARVVKWIGGILAPIILAVLAWGALRVLAQAESGGETRIKIQRLEQDMQRCLYQSTARAPAHEGPP